MVELLLACGHLTDHLLPFSWLFVFDCISSAMLSSRYLVRKFRISNFCFPERFDLVAFKAVWKVECSVVPHKICRRSLTDFILPCGSISSLYRLQNLNLILWSHVQAMRLLMCWQKGLLSHKRWREVPLNFAGYLKRAGPCFSSDFLRNIWFYFLNFGLAFPLEFRWRTRLWWSKLHIISMVHVKTKLQSVCSFADIWTIW